MAVDSKSALNQFLQKFLKRPVTKEDVVYFAGPVEGGGFQSSVKLRCFEEELEFVGELAPTDRLAQKFAADQVLAHFADEIAAVELEQPTKRRKVGDAQGHVADMVQSQLGKATHGKGASKGLFDQPVAGRNGVAGGGSFPEKARPAAYGLAAPSAGAGRSKDSFAGWKALQSASPAAGASLLASGPGIYAAQVGVERPVASTLPDHKSMLNTFLQRYCQRPITKDDVIYTVQREDGMHQAILSLQCFEEAQEFAGELATTAKEAEHLAAAQALEAYATEVAQLFPGGIANGRKRPASAVAPDSISPFTKGSYGGGKASGLFGTPPSGKSPFLIFPSKGASPSKGAVGAQGLAQVPLPKVQPDTDPKSVLNQFLQKFCGRSVTKEDLIYETVQVGGGFQATLVIPCLDGVPEFAGHPCPSMKQAEKSAAAEVLKTYAADVQACLGVQTSPTPKRKAVAPSGAGAPAPVPVSNRESSQNSKTDLNVTCLKILRQALTKGDISYETTECPGGWISCVRLKCLPAADGSEATWTSAICATSKEAELDAAREAVEALQADPQHTEALIALPKSKLKAQQRGLERAPSL